MKREENSISPRKNIQSVEIGFSILKVLIKSSIPMPLKSIAEECNMSPSKVHSYLVSFCNLDMVQQDGRTGFYSLGKYTLQMGLAYVAQADIFTISKSVMSELAVKMGHSIFLGVWGSRGPTIVYKIEGTQSPPIFELRIGSVLPLLDSALGLNFSAHLPFDYLKDQLKAELKITKSQAKFKTLDDVKKYLKIVKEQRISSSRGCLLTEFTGISVPLFDYNGSIVACLTVMGRIGVLDDSLNGKHAKMLKEAAKTISDSMGYQAF